MSWETPRDGASPSRMTAGPVGRLSPPATHLCSTTRRACITWWRRARRSTGAARCATRRTRRPRRPGAPSSTSRRASTTSSAASQATAPPG
uniref:Expressed protein n=2 Tax=Oryza sativa subsp. japonica TaxID=39947 RepID=Q2R5T0_ORYSJ|nr:expressed protein [Oryza sativa Japonica Group]ABA93197.1 expressed protein [Oryza sativa Japonica Group]